jgi:hypothetical protein
MILRIVIAVLVFIISYAGFLAANTPAAWVVAEARPQLAKAQATLGDVKGSAWSGSGELSLKGHDLGRLYWHASPWPLISGNLHADFIVKSNNFHLSGKVAADGKTTRLANIKGRAGIDLLAPLVGIPAGLTGTLTANLDHVVLKRQAIQSAQGKLVAHGVRIPDLGIGLGNLTLTLHNTSGSVQGQINNSGGDITLRGHLTLTKTGAYVLQATLKPHPSSTKKNMIRDGLTAILGAQDSSGRFHYHATGRLSLH